MPEMHLIQPGFTYSTCGPFTKDKEKIKKSKERGLASMVYQLFDKKSTSLARPETLAF